MKEDNILKVSLYKVENFKKADLLSHLNDLHKKLATVGQEDRPKGLNDVATHLIKRPLLSNSDRDVRLVSLCCLIDILRIYAPEAPFRDEDTIDVFEAIITQFRGLSTIKIDSATGALIFYLLNSLSAVKSCVIPVLLSQAGVRGASEVVASLFETLLNAAHNDQSEAVLEHICSILQSCLEESNDLDTEIIEILLSPLLPTSKVDNPISYKIIETVLKNVSHHIEPFLSKHIIQILVGSSTGESLLIIENIYSIIYELHKISSELLNNIIPNLCIQLDADEEDVRLKAVKLIGRLFASKHANYGCEFARNFKEYLNRFCDLEISIRLEMIETGALIMSRQPLLLSSVEDMMVKRLRDPDYKVRLLCLNKLVEIATENLLSLKPDTIQEMGQRVKDKKSDIVSIAILGLSKIYSKYLSSQLLGLDEYEQQQLSIIKDYQDLNEDTDRAVIQSKNKRTKISPAKKKKPNNNSLEISFRISSTISKDVLDRCEFIPGLIINCWGYPDTITRHLLMQMLQEYILPRNAKSNREGIDEISSDDTAKKTKDDYIDYIRASALIYLFEILNDMDRNSLGTILGTKTRIRLEMNNFFLSIQNIQNRGSASNLQFFNTTHNTSGISTSLSQNISDANQDISSLLNDTMEMDYEDMNVPLMRTIHRLYQSLPPPNDKKPPNLEKLSTMKDKRILKLFSRCILPNDNVVESIKYRDDLLQRLDSKSMLSQYCGYLYDISGFLFLNKNMINIILKFVLNIKSSINKARITTINEANILDGNLLYMLAKHVSLVYKNTTAMLKDLLVLSIPSDFNKTASLSLYRNIPSIIKYISSVICTDDDVFDLCRTISDVIFACNVPDICEVYAEALLRIELHIEHSNSFLKKQMIESSNIDISSDWSQVKKLVTSLVQQNRLNHSSPRLLCDLRVLSTIFKVPPSLALSIDFKTPYTSLLLPTFESYKDSIIIFIRDNIISRDYFNSISMAISNMVSQSNNSTKNDDGDDDGDRDENVVIAVRNKVAVICEGLILWTSMLGTEEEIAQWISNKYNANSDLFHENQTDLPSGLVNPNNKESQKVLMSAVSLLFSSISTNGTCFGDSIILSENNIAGLNDDQKELIINDIKKISETATLCVISFLKLKILGIRLSIENWRILAWQFIESDTSFKKKLVETFGMMIQTYALHPRFLAIQCLLATDDSFSKYASSVLLFSMKRLRATYEGLKSRILTFTTSQLKSEDKNDQQSIRDGKNLIYLKRLALLNMPETILPYVLYILSYHPDFPTSSTLEDESDKKKVQVIISCIRMVINCLFGSLNRDADNLSYLLKQVNTLVQDYVDRVDPGNIGIHFVSRLTIQLLKENIKTSENVQVFPGDIHLPLDLFLHKKNSNQLQNKDPTYIEEVLAVDTIENTQETFEKVFHNKVLKGSTKERAKTKRLMSPIVKKRPIEQANSRKVKVSPVPVPVPKKRIKRKKDEDDEEPSVSSKDHTIHDDDNDDDNDDTPKSQVFHHRPQRAAKNRRISYKEKEESEKEAELWDQEMAKQKSMEARRKSFKDITHSTKESEKNISSLNKQVKDVSKVIRESINPIRFSSESGKYSWNDKDIDDVSVVQLSSSMSGSSKGDSSITTTTQFHPHINNIAQPSNQDKENIGMMKIARKPKSRVVEKTKSQNILKISDTNKQVKNMEVTAKDKRNK